VIRSTLVDLRPLPADESEAILAGERGRFRWSAGYPTPGDVETAGWPASGDPRFAPLQIVERSSGLAVGGIGCHGAPIAGVVEVGHGLAPEAQGRGLAAAALAALVEFLEAQPEVTTIIAHADAAASARVLARCGFHLDPSPVDGRARWVRAQK
jgi:RimJ/RimL family protein N-acetyltransferase